MADQDLWTDVRRFSPTRSRALRSPMHPLITSNPAEHGAASGTPPMAVACVAVAQEFAGAVDALRHFVDASDDGRVGVLLVHPALDEWVDQNDFAPSLGEMAISIEVATEESSLEQQAWGLLQAEDAELHDTLEHFKAFAQARRRA